MKIVSSILKRAAGPALVAGLVVTSAAAPAAAAATAATPGSTAFRFFGVLAGLQARSGVANDVRAEVIGGRLILSDATGVAIGPGCTRRSATSADCGSVSTVPRLVMALDDMDDKAVVDASVGASVNVVVDAGTGRDNVTTAGGSDLIDVQDNGSGDTVSCGGGVDTVFADTGDTVSSNCEKRF
ncbi:hypothetical protein AQJ66_13880 [Streptomyces bungoensis]|uniref:Calcium-binding protein n=1 Tax=Streptomyces bungoensis TaxID=285568 RepID=A0A117RDS0_9ACTN|nr:hypothetical protein AQJ66_13880 [Streptomyces bungoensis]